MTYYDQKMKWVRKTCGPLHWRLGLKFLRRGYASGKIASVAPSQTSPTWSNQSNYLSFLTRRLFIRVIRAIRGLNPEMRHGARILPTAGLVTLSPTQSHQSHPVQAVGPVK